MNEHDIQNQLMINISKNPNLTPFRINVGTGWTGFPSKNRDGTMTLKNPRPFRTGVPKGFPDVFILNKRKIKQEDIGKEFCEFMFLEVKTEDGKLSEEQIDFIKLNKCVAFSLILSIAISYLHYFTNLF